MPEGSGIQVQPSTMINTSQTFNQKSKYEILLNSDISNFSALSVKDVVVHSDLTMPDQTCPLGSHLGNNPKQSFPAIQDQAPTVSALMGRDP